MSSIGSVGGVGGMGGAGAVSVGGSAGTVPAVQGPVGVGSDPVAATSPVGDGDGDGGGMSQTFNFFESGSVASQMSTSDFATLQSQAASGSSGADNGLNLKKLLEWMMAIKMMEAFEKES